MRRRPADRVIVQWVDTEDGHPVFRYTAGWRVADTANWLALDLGLRAPLRGAAARSSRTYIPRTAVVSVKALEMPS